MSKVPLDPFPYGQDPRSHPARPGIPDGLYAYARDERGIVWLVPDGPHIHPKILGGGQPAMYAGDLTIQQAAIADVTNLSGTFQFDDLDGLLAVTDQLIRQGFVIRPGAVRWFPADGSRPQTVR